MAFSETNRIKIAQILGLTPLNISDQIAYIGSRLTSAVQTAIETQITLWDAGPGAVTEYARLVPKESNKGVETNPEKDEQKIQMAIAVLLERPDWGSGHSVEFELSR